MKITFFKLLSISTIFAFTFISCAKPIEACFDYSPASIDTNTTVTFNAGCSENAFQYKWNFGDDSQDTISEGFIVKHRYKKAGVYKITLNAQRKDGVTIRKEKPVIEKTITVN